MSKALKRLAEVDLVLPTFQPTTGNLKFKPFVISGNLLYISGQLPLGFGDIREHIGQLGKDCDVQTGINIAKIVALNVIYQANIACGGDLDKIKRCVKITVFVNSSNTFTDQPVIANAISDIMLIAFEGAGEHARSAIGVSQLPFGVAVEAEAIFEMAE